MSVSTCHSSIAREAAQSLGAYLTHVNAQLLSIVQLSDAPLQMDVSGSLMTGV